MKSANATLITFLATSKQAVMTETYEFTLLDGTVLTFTTGDPLGNFVPANANEPQAPIITS